MYQYVEYEDQFSTWQRNSTALIPDNEIPYTDMDDMAKALVECDRKQDYERYDFIANMMLDSLEINAYLDVLSRVHNSKPAGKDGIESKRSPSRFKNSKTDDNPE